MAQVVKSASTGMLTPLPGGRQPAGMRSVATMESAPIEAMSPQGGVSHDDSHFLFQDFGQGRRSQDRHQGPVRNPLIQGVNSTSQTFAAIFELNQGINSDGAGGGSGAAFAAGLMSKAINIYESNAKLIASTEAVRGSTISINF